MRYGTRYKRALAGIDGLANPKPVIPKQSVSGSIRSVMPTW